MKSNDTNKNRKTVRKTERHEELNERKTDRMVGINKWKKAGKEERHG